MKLYIWGTGCAAGELLDHGLAAGELCGFVDSDARQESFLGLPVQTPEALVTRDFDLILVASRQVEAISARAELAGLPADKLFYLKDNWQLRDRNCSYEAASSVLRTEVLRALQKAPRLMPEPRLASASKLDERDLLNDPVRLRTLEALCKRIESGPGAAAELGVYRGGFARCINALLPDRRLYLFDTFEGFDENESAEPGLRAEHQNNSLAQVLSLLPHPEQACIRKGLFPDTTAGLEEERFALVSLDVDLEESTLAGLRWFLPRMNPGGYLLLHNYNNPALPGVKAALARYETMLGKRLAAVPLSDLNGTLVICL